MPPTPSALLLPFVGLRGPDERGGSELRSRLVEATETVSAIGTVEAKDLEGGKVGQGELFTRGIWGRTAAAAIRISGRYPVKLDFLFPLILTPSNSQSLKRRSGRVSSGGEGEWGVYECVVQSKV